VIMIDGAHMVEGTESIAANGEADNETLLSRKVAERDESRWTRRWDRP